ncbi:hypothetical protein TSTA_004620 [Talaromyces stipitatus ATCC 10500]|uniref:Cytochrome P450 n=1 Tax=Talaromyces stipitatus (strain ATCC 10500 / CBS 375.48 / QM 6759 / NRRL 1006) TaxID=441959 RepID=B8MTL0_TALSN|nr:uncharacterized protein TSTA_004620 [Talaromyces stipitatus ATCC 10500]EED12416.1 hypothetical protein TSTA_004620 [Talaromyces stipitatus ATCC 10500]
MNCPPNISKIISPATSGIVDLRQVRDSPSAFLRAQIEDLAKNPESLRNLPHSTTIYHELLRPEAYRSGTVSSGGSLYYEAQALLFEGADTTGLCTALSHIDLANSVSQDDAPGLYEVQKLPYLTAVLRKSPRMSPDVAYPLPRVVPSGGATIDKVLYLTE